MPGDSLGLSRAPAPPLDKPQLGLQASARPAAPGMQQLQQQQQQQQNDAETGSEYARLLLAQQAPLTPLPWPGASVNASATSAAFSSGLLYAGGGGLSGGYPGSGAVFGGTGQPITLHAFEAVSAEARALHQGQPLLHITDGTAGPAASAAAATAASGAFCLQTAPLSAAVAAPGLKVLGPEASAGASQLASSSSYSLDRAPPGLQVEGSYEFLAEMEQQPQRQRGQQQSLISEQIFLQTGSHSLHAPSFQGLQQHQPPQQQQLHNQQAHIVHLKQPQLQQQLQHQLLQQQLHSQQQLQHQLQQQLQQQLHPREQHVLQRELRFQLQQGGLLSDGHGAHECPLRQEPRCSYGRRWVSGGPPQGAAETAHPSPLALVPSGALKAATPEAPQLLGPHGGLPATFQGSRRAAAPEERGVERLEAVPAGLEMWRQVLWQRESRPLRLSRFEMVEAYAKSTLCLSCDSMEHKITNCPFGEFVCPNCHRSSHRGEHCPLPCRFCFERHAGISVNECIRRTVRQPLERLLGVKMPLDPSLSRRQKRDLQGPHEDGKDFPGLALRRADRPNTPHGRSVYVSNMLPGTTKESLRTAINFLLDHGQVVCVEMRERSNFLPYAFVELSSLQAAYELVQYKKSALVIGDQELKVQFKKIGLACTAPPRSAAPGTPEEVEPQKRSPVSLMAPFTSTGQSVQEVCRLVAFKLAQDFGLPLPGLPPRISGEDVAAAALLPQTASDGSAKKVSGPPMGALGSPGSRGAPGVLGIGNGNVCVEAIGGKAFRCEALQSQEAQKTETEPGCLWSSEIRKLTGEARAFGPHALRAVTRLPGPGGIQATHQLQMQQIPQQLYGNRPCPGDSLAGRSPGLQGLRPLSPPEGAAQLPLQPPAGLLPLDEQQQHKQVVAHHAACLRGPYRRGIPQSVGNLHLREQMSGEPPALCSGPAQGSLEASGRRSAAMEQEVTGRAQEETVDCQRAQDAGRSVFEFSQAPMRVGGLGSPPIPGLEDLTPFPGVHTSKSAAAVALHEPWSCAGAGRCNGSISKQWAAHQGEAPTPNATASTALSSSLGCESLPSPSACRGSGGPGAPQLRETGDGDILEAPHRETREEQKGDGANEQRRNDLAANESAKDALEREPSNPEAVPAEYDKTPQPHKRPDCSVPGDEGQRAAHSQPEARTLLRPGPASYFEMDVSDLMKPSAGTGVFDESSLDRGIPLPFPQGTPQWPSEPGDGTWWREGGSLRAFSRRAHQMGLPSLMKALKSEKPKEADPNDPQNDPRPTVSDDNEACALSLSLPQRGLPRHSCNPLTEEQKQHLQQQPQHHQRQSSPCALSPLENAPEQAVPVRGGPKAATLSSLMGRNPLSREAPSPSCQNQCLQIDSAASPGAAEALRSAQEAPEALRVHRGSAWLASPEAQEESSTVASPTPGATGTTLLVSGCPGAPFQGHELFPGSSGTAGYNSRELQSAVAAMEATTTGVSAPPEPVCPCEAKQSTKGVLCLSESPVPRRASSSNPKAPVALRGGPVAAADWASPLLPVATDAAAKLDRPISVNLREAGVPVPRARRRPSKTEAEGVAPATAQNSPAAGQDTPCFRLVLAAKEDTADAAACTGATVKESLKDSKAAGLKVPVRLKCPAGLPKPEHDLAQDPGHTRSKVKALCYGTEEKNSWAGRSQRKDETQTEMPASSDTSVELLLAQIDDITKQLPPKVIEAVWASLTNARANATSAAAAASAAPETAAPAAAAGRDRGLCSPATAEAIPAKGVGAP